MQGAGQRQAPWTALKIRIVQIHHVEVTNGEGAYDDFVNEIKRIFGITEEHDMQLAFDCADPVTGIVLSARIRTVLELYYSPQFRCLKSCSGCKRSWHLGLIHLKI